MERKSVSFRLRIQYFQTLSRFRVLFQESTNPCLPLTVLFRYGFKIFSILILFLLCISLLYLSPNTSVSYLFSGTLQKFRSRPFFTVHDDNAQFQQLGRTSATQMPLSVALNFFFFFPIEIFFLNIF